MSSAPGRLTLMRWRTTLGALLAGLMISLGAACGGPEPVTTGTIVADTTVKPEQYLADTRAVATAVTEFAAVVNALPTPLTQGAVAQGATAMDVPLQQMRDAQGRLAAMRLEDQRLETQRQRVAEASAQVLSAMQAMRQAAGSRDLAGTKAAAADVQTAIAALRAVGGPTT